MATVAFTRLRMLWGALDWQQGTDHPYASAQTVSGGSSVGVPGGIGVRRAELVIDRTLAHAGGDADVCHFDFLNMTGGSPDDTWTTTDFTGLETKIESFWTALVGQISSHYRLTQINWYRVGSGAPHPNPAERALTLTTPIAGGFGGHTLAPQSACSLTLRNGVRKSWGRTYLPLVALSLDSTGSISHADVDTIAGAANTLVTSASSTDMILGTYSARLNAFLACEHVEVDDVIDVIRRRRWKASTYKKIIP